MLDSLGMMITTRSQRGKLWEKMVRGEKWEKNAFCWTLTAFNWDSYGRTDRIDWTTLGQLGKLVDMMSKQRVGTNAHIEGIHRYLQSVQSLDWTSVTIRVMDNWLTDDHQCNTPTVHHNIWNLSGGCSFLHKTRVCVCFLKRVFGCNCSQFIYCVDLFDTRKSPQSW